MNKESFLRKGACVCALLFLASASVSFASLESDKEENVLVNCSFTGDALRTQLEKSWFNWRRLEDGEKFVGLDLTLVEVGTPIPYAVPSKLMVRVYKYIEKDDEVRRVQNSRALERVGYAFANGMAAISYTSFNGGDNPDFVILTDGGVANVITYSATGSRRRDFGASPRCEIFNDAAIEAEPVDYGFLTDSERVELIQALRYRRSFDRETPEFNKKEQKQYAKALRKLQDMVEKLDFSKEFGIGGAEVIGWVNDEGCGELERSDYTDLQVVRDYAHKIAGYILPRYKCTNDIEASRYKWDEDTGERFTVSETRKVYVDDVITDDQFKVLPRKRDGDEDNPYVYTSRW